MSFGYSAGDIYLCAQLVGSVIESFRKGPRGATLQYSNFEAEFRLISKQLDELPEKSSSFVDLWGRVKAQCAEFVVRYSSLVPASIKVGDKEAKWRWVYAQGLMAFAKVQWPFMAREEAMALERNMLHLVQIAILDVNTRHYKTQQWSHERYESLLQQVSQQYAENSKWTDDQIGMLQGGVEEIKGVLLPDENMKLFNRIEIIREHARDIMRPRKSLSLSVQESSQTTTSYDLSIKLPFEMLHVNVRPSEFTTFEEAYEELGAIATIMNNHVTRQQSGPLPNASSVVALLEHISQTIKVALSWIGSPLPDDVGESSNFTSDQKQLEATLNLIYCDWVRFLKLAMYHCKRSRPVSNLSTPQPVHHSEGQSWSRLENITEENQFTTSHRGRHDISINPAHSEKSRRVSRDISPRTRESLSTRRRSFASSSVANSTVEKPVKMDISHADGSQDKTGELLKHCTISEIKFEIESDIVVVKVRSLDKKVKLHQEFGRITKPSFNQSNKAQPTSLNYYNSYQNFRALDDTQIPHPSGAPIYVFNSKDDSHAFQTEVLQQIIPGWEVIYSAETQRIEHTRTGNDCHLQILRVIQEDRTRHKSILYWETRCLELTGGKADFVEWSPSEFDSVIEKGKMHAILRFVDPNGRRKSFESKPSRLSISLRRSSKDSGQPPPQSPSVSPPQLPPLFYTPSSFGNSPDGEDLKSLRTSGAPSLMSISAASVSSFALPSSALEAKVEAKEKEKKKMGGLDIKFYSQKDRDDFLKSFGWTPLSPNITYQIFPT